MSNAIIFPPAKADYAKPWSDLKAHAEEKMRVEQEYHVGMDRSGRKIPHNRIDRRPLWEAVIHLSGYLATYPPPIPLSNRQDAWTTLCYYSAGITGVTSSLPAIIEFSSRLKRCKGPLRLVRNQ